MANKAVEGLKRVPTIRARTQADKDRDARASGSKLSVPTGLEKPDPISTPYNKLMGLFESVTDPSEWNSGSAAKAGLPFAAYAAKGVPRVFHGTQKVFERFDPRKYDTNDILGSLTHFAEDPHYANYYAMGHIPGKNPIAYVDDNPSAVTASELSPYLKYGDHSQKGIQAAPTVIPAVPEAKNILDLIQPNADDMSQALASLPINDRSRLVRSFRQNTQFSNNPIQRLADLFKSYMTESSLKQSPYDAVRYFDAGEKALAVPVNTPVKSQFGAPLMPDTGTPLRVLKTDKSYGGQLEVAPDRWANTPMSLPEVPNPEYHKLQSPIRHKP